MGSATPDLWGHLWGQWWVDQRPPPSSSPGAMAPVAEQRGAPLLDGPARIPADGGTPGELQDQVHLGVVPQARVELLPEPGGDTLLAMLPLLPASTGGLSLAPVETLTPLDCAAGVVDSASALEAALAVVGSP